MDGACVGGMFKLYFEATIDQILAVPSPVPSPSPPLQPRAKISTLMAWSLVWHYEEVLESLGGRL